MPIIKIAIADDYPVFREGLIAGLSMDDDLQVIIEADNGQLLLDALENQVPDVILMDLKMPVMDGMAATQAVKEKYPQVKVLVISMYDDNKFVTHLMNLGANGYLLKNAEPIDIRQAIYSVMNNHYFFNDQIDKVLIKDLMIKNKLQPAFNKDIQLTESELEALRFFCAEEVQENNKKANDPSRNMKEVYDQLMKRIGVPNKAGLVMFAVAHGIIG